jgi:trimeric autotransporter adhesin
MRIHLAMAVLLVPAVPALAPAAYAAPRTKAPTLTVSPARSNLRLGESRQFRARLKHLKGPVEWEVVSPDGGTVTPAGFYQAPVSATTPTTVRLRARAAGDRSVTGEAVIDLLSVSINVKQPKGALAPAETIQLHSSVQGTSETRVRWSVEGGSGNGEISGSGLYTAPTQFVTPGTVTVRATSLADPSKSATTQVKINSLSLDVHPKQAKIGLGHSFRFSARVKGTPNTAVTWKVLSPNQGEISSSGLYTAPATMATPTVVSIAAVSSADPSKMATAQVQILPVELTLKSARRRKGAGFAANASRVLRLAVSRVSRLYMPFNPLDVIVVGPLFVGKSGKQYVPLGGGVPLDADVRNSSNERVTWEIEGAQVGRLTDDGVYYAPTSLTTPQIVHIRVTSVADPTKTITHTLHIPQVHVEVGKKDRVQTCPLGSAVQLAAKVENSENDDLLWTVEGGPRFGSVSETGLFRPPTSLATPTIVKVRAASAADPTKYALIEVNIPEIRLEVDPRTANLKPGQTVLVKAQAKGSQAVPEVLWTLSPSVGRISPEGLYEAPANGGAATVEVTATLKADPTKQATTTIRLRGD